jgi:hypothetical protein
MFDKYLHCYKTIGVDLNYLVRIFGWLTHLKQQIAVVHADLGQEQVQQYINTTGTTFGHLSKSMETNRKCSLLQLTLFRNVQKRF